MTTSRALVLVCFGLGGCSEEGDEDGLVRPAQCSRLALSPEVGEATDEWSLAVDAVACSGPAAVTIQVVGAEALDPITGVMGSNLCFDAQIVGPPASAGNLPGGSSEPGPAPLRHLLLEPSEPAVHVFAQLWMLPSGTSWSKYSYAVAAGEVAPCHADDLRVSGAAPLESDHIIISIEDDSNSTESTGPSAPTSVGEVESTESPTSTDESPNHTSSSFGSTSETNGSSGSSSDSLANGSSDGAGSDSET